MYDYDDDGPCEYCGRGESGNHCSCEAKAEAAWERRREERAQERLRRIFGAEFGSKSAVA